MIGLTPRQQDALRFIAGYVEAHCQAPTVTEVIAGIGLASTSGAHRLLTGLAERGAIDRASAARAIQVLAPVAIPRTPTGEPLYFVRIPQ